MASDRIVIDTIVSKYCNHLPLYRQSAILERDTGLELAARYALRQERAMPLLEEIKAQIEAAQSSAPPSSALAKACRYTLTLWPKLIRFLDYPELELSNNLAENSMRPVALGRKNWIHVGSPLGRTQDCRHPVRRGKLPQDETSRAQISRRRSSRARQSLDPARDGTRALRLDRQQSAAHQLGDCDE